MVLPQTTQQTEYIRTLEDMAMMIQNAQMNLKKCPKQRLTIGYIKSRQKTIDEYWDVFKTTHNSLTKCTEREQKGILPYFLNEDFYKIEDLYICLQADLSDLVLKLEAQKNSSHECEISISSQDGQLSMVNLPRIQLPTFSGKYEDWPTYQDLFNALVHNTKLTNVQKLHYLKTSVSGEAELLLRHIQITDSNYKQAWESLEKRFGNKKMIVNSLLKRLFCQKKIINHSASQIKTLLDTTTECINSLNNLKINTESWDPMIIFLVGQKLDTELLKDWEQQSHKDANESDELPKWEDMKKFLEAKFRTMELVAPVATYTRDRNQIHKSFHVAAEESEDNSFQSAHASVTSQPSCSYCKGEHYIFHCKDFAKRTVAQRQDFVKNNRLCFNCLVPNHNVFRCRQKTSCRVCRKKHHSLLHQIKESNRDDNAQAQPESEQEHKIIATHLSREQPGHEVILATARVHVKSRDGNTHTLRALIDQGSEASFVSERVVQLLGLPRSNIKGVVSGVGEGTQISIKHLVDLKITSRFKTNEIRVNAYVLKHISSQIPSKHIVINCPKLHTIPLADPAYFTPGKIDILLGADVFCKIIEDGLCKMTDGLVAQKTTLGWILSGQREQQNNHKQHNVIALHITNIVAEDNDMLRKFWEIETDVYKKKIQLTKEEAKCEEIYNHTTKRDGKGRYVVHLPLKQNIKETLRLCGETKQQAVTRFQQLERRFNKSEYLKTEYSKVINEYKEMGHLKRSDVQDSQEAIYLPHLAVIREDKDTSKVRVVFDASAKGSHGYSLNDTMMIGPVLQPDLRSIITAWRRHKICVVGDIVKMYRMINMTDEHVDLQRIVWRDTPDDELESYNLTTVTFGTAAAPYLAVRTLNRLADDEANEYPDAAAVIKNSFYMDDLMVGNTNIEKTKTMCEEIREVLKRGGFKMQKWSSNSEEVLQFLKQEKTKDTLEIKLDKIIRILGLKWNRQDDAFVITVDLPELRSPLTKRFILSDVARLFDPFGWLSPVIVMAKVMIQKLWLSNLGWDDELPLKLSEEWKNYRSELMHLRGIKLPRWLKITHIDEEEVQLHGFADASTQAYAAVTYLRVVTHDDVHVTLIASRTKVAPLKQLSIPKLELCAAALLADLIHDVAEILSIPKNKIFVWTDSMVVLSWLQSQPVRWKTFVANRTAEITRIIDNDRWRHVQSADNPADVATRGIRACDLAAHKLWWMGPHWLKQQFVQFDKTDIPQTDLELKCSHNTLQGEKPIWERFSTLSRMKRVLAYCRRLCRRTNLERASKHLTTNELEKIEEECIRFYQNLVYSKEIEELKINGQVKKKSSLITLSPFLDEKGLLRVRGRLENASVSENIKHPIIIPRNQHITELIINEAHTRTLHGWNQLMIAYVRTKYWVIGLKSSIKKCIRNCKPCIIDKAKSKNQLMGQLPAVRVNPHRAFINSGVDYAGPISIRTSKGRGQHATKGYICLFVCMSTRAIHLEAVTDLTSQAFIAAFRRFVARRGHCKHIWSDNGTNFIGAAKELKELFQNSKDSLAGEIAELLANAGTTWHFIPPKMPTHGGIWEAGIRSAKKHLARVNRDTKLTYEEMATLLAQIEACLNSRPLCLLDDKESTLTPGHFLVGESLISVPDISYESKKIHLLTRWQLIQKMTQDFWHKWQKEYLHTLQQRSKWQVAIKSPAIGDIVIIKDELMPPSKWLLGRIKHLHPGADDLVRVVTVQCKGNHELKRPLSKIILLPKSPEDQ